MAIHKLLLLPGDGIGPEVMAEVKRLIDWLNGRRLAHFETEQGLVGGSAYDAHRVSITEDTMARAKAADAVIFVTPEYDHAPPPSLINALIYLSQEWAHKPVGFVSYGGPAGGTRAVQMVKPMLAGLKLVPLFESVIAPLFTKSITDGKFNASELQETQGRGMLDALAKWVTALAPMRAG